MPGAANIRVASGDYQSLAENEPEFAAQGRVTSVARRNWALTPAVTNDDRSTVE